MSERRLTGRGAAAIVKGFLQYLDANQYAPLCLATICADLGLAERTLRAACEVQLGMGPIRYLNHHRMQLVRLALLEADASKITVTPWTIASGSWDSSRWLTEHRSRSHPQQRCDDDQALARTNVMAILGRFASWRDSSTGSFLIIQPSDWSE